MDKIWHNLFNCVQDLERNDMSFNAEYNDDIVVTTEEVVTAVQKLDTHLLENHLA